MDRLGFRLAFIGLLAVSTLGCPGDDGSSEEGSEPTSSADTSATSSSPTSTSVATDGGSTSEATASGGSGPGQACGEASCAAIEYCDWNANTCGTQPWDAGSCVGRPDGCAAVYEPVCGCDGQVYGNGCDASVAGIDVDADGECEAPEGYFRCGYRFCNIGVEYCQVAISDVGGEPDGYSCVQTGMPCEPFDCDCLTMEPCYEFGCMATEDGGIEIVCPGG